MQCMPSAFVLQKSCAEWKCKVKLLRLGVDKPVGVGAILLETTRKSKAVLREESKPDDCTVLCPGAAGCSPGWRVHF
jgi:hypothetical protein